MRPDRIIIGEVRGEEAFDMLQAMNTGHEGSMTTIHANTPRDALSRLESMVAMTNMNLPEKSVRQQITSAITIVVQATRMSDGTRKMTSIAEITGMEENVISMQEIFTFQKKGIGPDGRVIGAFLPTRIRPRFLERLRISGIILPPSLFERETPVAKRKEGIKMLLIIASGLYGSVHGCRIAVAGSGLVPPQQASRHWRRWTRRSQVGDTGRSGMRMLNLRKNELLSTIPWLNKKLRALS